MRWDRIEIEAQRGEAERNRKSQPNTALKQIAFTPHPHPPPRECKSESQLVSVSASVSVSVAVSAPLYLPWQCILKTDYRYWQTVATKDRCS